MRNEEQQDYEEWYKFGDRDLGTARILAKHKGQSDNTAFFLQQAVEKFLKGYLLKHGWKLKKIHDLEELITEASEHDITLKKYLSFARIISAVYVESRYPSGPLQEYSSEEISKWLSETEEIISKIKKAKE